ncbi:MAG: histidine phosphatase family protein [Thermoflexales bacterium]|nr:histidine phosphatase family protein [Thermoflexales bacterium]
MQLYFIRHGQSENNALWARTASSMGRSHDPEISTIGRQQAESLARFLSQFDPAVAASDYDKQNVTGFGFTHLYCSLMVRAVATGRIVARALGLPLVAWEDWHESGGIYLNGEESGLPLGQAGNSRSYFEAHYPELILPDAMNDAGWWNRPYEQPEERPLRAQRVLRELIERHGQAQDRVAVISHGGFYNHFLKALLDPTRKDGRWFYLNNAAISRIDFQLSETESVELVYLNRLDFLPKELVT